MSTPVSILYTWNLGGDLDLLPRLYTFIKRLRSQAQRFEDEAEVALCAVQPPARQTLLVDVGGACAADVWHCRATGGRSTLVVLDAMGYDAAHVTGVLATEARERLESTVTLALVDADHSASRGDVLLTAVAKPDARALQLVMQPRADAALEGDRLYPARIGPAQLGLLHVASAGGWRLSAHDVFDLPPRTQPDPTIAGAVDFVLGEAYYYERKRGG